jgi:hypothetical protein
VSDAYVPGVGWNNRRCTVCGNLPAVQEVNQGHGHVRYLCDTHMVRYPLPAPDVLWRVTCGCGSVLYEGADGRLAHKAHGVGSAHGPLKLERSTLVWETVDLTAETVTP